MATFDSERLRVDLAGLTRWQRIAFAAGCAEVLVPAYARFSTAEGTGDPVLVRATTDAVWAGLEAAATPSPEAIRVLSPVEDDWNEWAPQAEDAIAALVYLLELIRNDDIDLAAYPAERAYSAIDELAARDGAPDDAVWAELQRQTDALQLLRKAGDDRSVVADLRAAAQRLPI